MSYSLIVHIPDNNEPTITSLECLWYEGPEAR